MNLIKKSTEGNFGNSAINESETTRPSTINIQENHKRNDKYFERNENENTAHQIL